MATDKIPNALTGAWIEVTRVDAYGETDESETPVAKTRGEVSFDRDSNDDEWTEHMNKREQRKELHDTLDVDAEAVVVPGMEHLETLGIIDVDGNEVSGDVWEAGRFYVYDEYDDDEAAEIFEAEALDWKWESISLPDDGAGTVDLTGWIHGDWRVGRTTTA